MAYAKTTWLDGITKLGPTNLNHLEQAAYDLKTQVYNVRDYGASFAAGAAANTAAINAAIADINVAGTGWLYFPNDIYDVNAGLTTPSGSGWKIIGQSPIGTQIRQNTNNTPIWQLTTDNAFNWEISNLYLTWLNQQTGSHTASHAIRFYLGSNSGSGWYHGRIADCAMRFGYRGIYTDAPGGVGYPVWDTSFERLWIGSMAAAGIKLNTNGQAGCPNNRLDRVYIENRSVANGESQLWLSSQSHITMTGLDLEGSAVHPILYADSSTGTINGIHLENMNITAASPYLVYWANNPLDVRGFHMPSATSTVNPSSGKFAVFFADAGASLTLSAINAAVTSSGSGVLVRSSGALSPVTILGKPTIGISNMTLYDDATWSGSAAATRLVQPDWAYAQITSPVTVSATAGTSPTLIVSSGGVSYDGSDVWIEFFTPDITVGNTTGSQVSLDLWDGATRLGSLGGPYHTTAMDIQFPVLVKTKITGVTAGVHTFKVQAYRAVSDGTIAAGNGTATNNVPAYIRVTSS